MIQVTEEEDRQALLLAIAHLALERPGWTQRLSAIATQLGGLDDFENFKRLSPQPKHPNERKRAALNHFVDAMRNEDVIVELVSPYTFRDCQFDFLTMEAKTL
jgi:hypothetical protein